jgi:hypothetical protein
VRRGQPHGRHVVLLVAHRVQLVAVQLVLVVELQLHDLQQLLELQLLEQQRVGRRRRGGIVELLELVLLEVTSPLAPARSQPSNPAARSQRASSSRSRDLRA